MGFFASRSHRIIDCSTCLLQPEAFTQAMEVFREWQAKYKEDIYDEKTGKGHLRHFYLRMAMATGEVMACVVVNGNGAHQEQELVELLRKRVPDRAQPRCRFPFPCAPNTPQPTG